MASADPLVVRRLEFLGGMARAGGWRPPEALPEIAFVGRSNVGKSSLLNVLVRRRAFARVSNTPGRTQEINFFRVNDAFLLVDLPGYGFARASKEKRSAWQELVQAYLTRSQRLCGVVALLDVRRVPTAEDLAMFALLSDLQVPVLLAITKADKVSRAAGEVALLRIAERVGLVEEQILLVSARTGEGRDALATAVVHLLEQDACRPA
jgi:GTP-binding protein